MEKCYHCNKEGVGEIELINKTIITVCKDCIEDYEECELCERMERSDDLEMEYLHALDDNRTCHFCASIILRNFMML